MFSQWRVSSVEYFDARNVTLKSKVQLLVIVSKSSILANSTVGVRHEIKKAGSLLERKLILESGK